MGWALLHQLINMTIPHRYTHDQPNLGKPSVEVSSEDFWPCQLTCIHAGLYATYCTLAGVFNLASTHQKNLRRLET